MLSIQPEQATQTIVPILAHKMLHSTRQTQADIMLEQNKNDNEVVIKKANP